MREVITCRGCGLEIAPALLSCPRCARLVHADRLKQLASEAEQSAQQGDLQAALVAWREALELLPAGSRQRDAVAARIAGLGRRADDLGAASSPLARSPAADSGRLESDSSHATHRLGQAGLAGVGTLGLLLWKFKFLAVLVLTKAKFLLLGLTKASTFLSMLLSLGVYWSAFGWRFALGLVLSIYVHEMGHVFVLNRYGVKASAPMFIPGFGALIRLRQELTDPRQDALVGLAGPIWGLGAALTALAVGLATGEPYWFAIAKLGAWINLFNLIPVWQLDGGRAFHALSRSGRWFAVMVIAVAWSLSEESLLLLLLIGGVFRALGSAALPRSDRVALTQYVFLIAVLSSLTRLPVVLP
jgi:Zn-dependent protease